MLYGSDFFKTVMDINKEPLTVALV